MATSDLLRIAAILPFPLALLWAAASDLYRFEIPNLIPIVLIIGYVVAAVALGTEPLILMRQLGIGAAALLIGMAFFALGIVGGGDVKLLAACMPWVAPSQIPAFLFWMAFIGGLLSLAVLLLKPFAAKRLIGESSWLGRISNGSKIPYGVAIGCAGFITLPHMPLLNN